MSISHRLARHATPIRMNARPRQPLRESVGSAARSSKGEQSSRSKASLVKDYNLEQLISGVKIQREEEREGDCESLSMNTLFDEYYKSGLPKRPLLRDADKIAKISALLHQLKEEQNCEQKMPIIQVILTRICGLLQEDSYCFSGHKDNLEEDSSKSLFQDLEATVGDEDERGLERVVRGECLPLINRTAVFRRLKQLERQYPY